MKTASPHFTYTAGSFSKTAVERSHPAVHASSSDIALLADHFIRHFNRTMHRNVLGISGDALELLRGYSWPGNVRELKNVIEGCFNMVGDMDGDGFLTKDDIPPYIETTIKHDIKLTPKLTADNDSRSLDEKVRDFEKKLILAALKENNSLSAAARAPSITRQNLRYKLEKHGINTEEILGSEKR